MKNSSDSSLNHQSRLKIPRCFINSPRNKLISNAPTRLLHSGYNTSINSPQLKIEGTPNRLNHQNRNAGSVQNTTYFPIRGDHYYSKNEIPIQKESSIHLNSNTSSRASLTNFASPLQTSFGFKSFSREKFLPRKPKLSTNSQITNSRKFVYGDVNDINNNSFDSIQLTNISKSLVLENLTKFYINTFNKIKDFKTIKNNLQFDDIGHNDSKNNSINFNTLNEKLNTHIKRFEKTLKLIFEDSTSKNQEIRNSNRSNSEFKKLKNRIFRSDEYPNYKSKDLEFSSELQKIGVYLSKLAAEPKSRKNERLSEKPLKNAMKRSKGRADSMPFKKKINSTSVQSSLTDRFNERNGNKVENNDILIENYNLALNGKQNSQQIVQNMDYDLTPLDHKDYSQEFIVLQPDQNSSLNQKIPTSPIKLFYSIFQVNKFNQKVKSLIIVYPDHIYRLKGGNQLTSLLSNFQILDLKMTPSGNLCIFDLRSSSFILIEAETQKVLSKFMINRSNIDAIDSINNQNSSINPNLTIQISSSRNHPYISTSINYSDLIIFDSLNFQIVIQINSFWDYQGVLTTPYRTLIRADTNFILGLSSIRNGLQIISLWAKRNQRKVNLAISDIFQTGREVNFTQISCIEQTIDSKFVIFTGQSRPGNQSMISLNEFNSSMTKVDDLKLLKTSSMIEDLRRVCDTQYQFIAVNKEYIFIFEIHNQLKLKFTHIIKNPLYKSQNLQIASFNQEISLLSISDSKLCRIKISPLTNFNMNQKPKNGLPPSLNQIFSNVSNRQQLSRPMSNRSLRLKNHLLSQKINPNIPIDKPSNCIDGTYLNSSFLHDSQVSNRHQSLSPHNSTNFNFGVRSSSRNSLQSKKIVNTIQIINGQSLKVIHVDPLEQRMVLGGKGLLVYDLSETGQIKLINELKSDGK